MSDDDRQDAGREQESAAEDAMHAAKVGGAHASPDDRRGGSRGGDEEAEDRTSQFEDTGSQPTGS
jgi:hypothetical protein